MEGFKEYQLPLTVTFVDFKKAFDSINRTTMFLVLQHCGIPETTVNAVQVLYSNSSSAVIVDGSISDPFDVTTGVLQGDVLAPFLFIILVDYLLGKASGLDSGVVTFTRQSRRYPARAQSQLTATADATADLGLVISVQKKRVNEHQLSPYGCRIVAIFNNIQFIFSNSYFCSAIVILYSMCHIFVQ